MVSSLHVLTRHSDRIESARNEETDYSPRQPCFRALDSCIFQEDEDDIDAVEEDEGEEEETHTEEKQDDKKVSYNNKLHFVSIFFYLLQKILNTDPELGPNGLAISFQCFKQRLSQKPADANAHRALRLGSSRQPSDARIAENRVSQSFN